jgi:hypothetical protein
LLYLLLFWGEQQAVVALVTAACNFSRMDVRENFITPGLAIRLSGN